MKNEYFKSTEYHPQLKENTLVKVATNPEGMYLADAVWVMANDGTLYYKVEQVEADYRKGYLKVAQ